MHLPNGLTREQIIKSVDWAIQNRVTEKVLSKSGAVDPQGGPEQLEQIERTIRDAISVAGWAPFHYDRKADGIAEPWRMHWLKCEACRKLAAEFETIVDEIKPGNKIPRMLDACSSMVLVTWIPQEHFENPAKLEKVNEEHLAAASAAVQNLLLALQARGFGTYWSSGGQLRDKSVFAKLNIDPSQKLLAAVFIDSEFFTNDQNVDRISGSQRVKRSPDQEWLRSVEV